MAKRNSSKNSNVDVISSGYTDCGCRDCFNIAITSSIKVAALCSACRDSGCEINCGECQSPTAYGCVE